MSGEQLTTELAVRAMGWRLASARKPDSGSTCPSRFRPLVDVKDALRALEAVTEDYSVIAKPGRVVVEVRLPKKTGRAIGKSLARTIASALGQGLANDCNESGPRLRCTEPGLWHVGTSASLAARHAAIQAAVCGPRRVAGSPVPAAGAYPSARTRSVRIDLLFQAA
jgi:hypothetical protein